MNYPSVSSRKYLEFCFSKTYRNISKLGLFKVAPYSFTIAGALGKFKQSAASARRETSVFLLRQHEHKKQN